MMRSYWIYFVLAGLFFVGCGSSNGSSPDTGTSRDTGNTIKLDAAPTAAPDAALAPDTRIADVAPALDTNQSDAPSAPDAPVLLDAGVVDAAVADAAVDAPGALDGPSAVDTGVDSARIDGPGVDVVGSEAGGEAGAGATFVAVLTGAQEVPPVATSASGSATFTLSADRTQLTYLVTHNVSGGTASHIHLAAAGENGAVIYPFTPFAATMSGTLSITASDADNLEQGKLYVNVHSSANPGGEIRGQILRPGEVLYVANLSGGQEAPPVTSTGSGTAAIILDAAKGSIRYHVNTSGLTLTNAHIHKGIATIAGPVVYPFSPVAATMDGTIAITSADAQDLADGHWYVNTHTAANPGGELRGQLMLPGEILYSATMSGANEVPPVTTSASGGSQFILDPTGANLRYEAVFTGLTATAAHIHTGAAGVSGPVLYPLTLISGGAKGTQAITSGDRTNLDAGGLYVNAHTTANPGGEIRGQIAKP